MHDKISSQGVKIIVISIISLVPAAIAVGFRIWARRIKGVTLALNDYAIVAALVCRSSFKEALANTVLTKFFAISEGVTILAGWSPPISTTPANMHRGYRRQDRIPYYKLERWRNQVP